MKTFWISAVLLLSCVAISMAADKVEAPAECQQCGMSRSGFSYSRMVVTYADGSSSGTCSLNCVVTDVKKANGKKAVSYQVADYTTRKLTDAKTATWVIGGNKSGVMTQIPKWAFARKKDADAFIRNNGGTLTTFEEAIKAAIAENTNAKEHQRHMH
jgi:nitrous oxide reductase accessory protein NosL